MAMALSIAHEPSFVKRRGDSGGSAPAEPGVEERSGLYSAVKAVSSRMKLELL